METIHPICVGLDVHQARVSACLRRVNAQGAASVESREFGTTVTDLVGLADWLVAEGCPIAAMESTGVYWKPVWNILSPLLHIWVVNARDVKQRRGKKSDRADTKWIAELVTHDLVQPSFVHPARIGVLRDLVRMRAVERFRSIGLSQVRLDVAEGNEPARQLFNACGFRPSVVEMLIEL